LYGDQATYFEQELKPRIKHTKRGQISMVNNGSNMHGSQVGDALFTMCKFSMLHCTTQLIMDE